MDAYRLLGNGKEMLTAAKEVIDMDPKNIQGLYWANLLTVSLLDKSPEALAAGEKYARGLIEATPDFLRCSQEAGRGGRRCLEEGTDQHGDHCSPDSGWVAMQRNQHEDAEKSF